VPGDADAQPNAANHVKPHTFTNAESHAFTDTKPIGNADRVGGRFAPCLTDANHRYVGNAHTTSAVIHRLITRSNDYTPRSCGIPPHRGRQI
jgi:hypothetical protein